MTSKGKYTAISLALAVCATLLSSQAAVAAANKPASLSNDQLVEGAKLCTRYLPRHERKYGIPLHLLAAIATTESGRYHQGLKMNLPWPWTVNAQGKGYFFDTKNQAIAQVRKLQAQGVKSIDVGCMQVNLYHHPDAFANLNEAFEPSYNVGYAAQFLRTNFDSEGSWRKAAAAYHSKTPDLGNKYVGLVYNSWRKILQYVKTGKANGAGGEQQLAMLENAPTPKMLKVAPDNAPAVAPKSPPVMQKIQAAAYRAPKMKIIELAGENKKAKAVRVLRGDEVTKKAPKRDDFVQYITPMRDVKPLVTAELSAPAESLVDNVAAPQIADEPVSTKKTGPKFIFN